MSTERGPKIGQINFGGGVAEQYQGDGRWRIFREDERHCRMTRYGMRHESHDYHYVYTRPDHLGGVTTGSVYCDGLATAAEPFPLIASVLGWASVIPAAAGVGGQGE